MELTFDYYHNLDKVDLYLCNPDGRELFPIIGENRNLVLRFNDLSELTFEIHPKATMSDGSTVSIDAYEYIQTKRLVYVTNIGWFQIASVSEQDNGASKYKSVTAESYQAVLKNKGFLSEERLYCFYNPADPYDEAYNPSNAGAIPSVLGQLYQQLGIRQALEQDGETPDTPYDDWTVTYINDSLVYTGASGACRTFAEGTTYGYDWIVNDVEEAFGVVVLFDFMYKTVQVKTVEEVAQKVNVIYTFQNFMKNIDVTEDAQDIVTVLNCNGNNCNIATVNPTGTNYICDFTYYMDKAKHRWMSDALIAKLEDWKTECDNSKEAYQSLIADLRELLHAKTEKTTILTEMSVFLQDLKNAQVKRSVVGDGDAGDLCGVIISESVKSVKDSKYCGNVESYENTPAQNADEGDLYGVWSDGRISNIAWRYDGSNWVEYDCLINGCQSLLNGNIFDGKQIVTAYQRSPSYNKEEGKWVFSGASITGTANNIVTSNLSETATTTYWYFTDAEDGSSYCKLKSGAKVNKDSNGDMITEHYCDGYDRYIAYSYPTVVTDEETGEQTATYTDGLQDWISIRESVVAGLNGDIHGSAYSNTEVKSVSVGADGYSSEVFIPSDDNFSQECDTITSVYVSVADGSNSPASLTGFINGDNQIQIIVYGAAGNTYDVSVEYSYSKDDSINDDSLNGQIQGVERRLSEISSRINILSYFSSTPSLLRELNHYWIEGDYTNDNISVLGDTTLEESIDLSNELLDAGRVELSKMCQPHLSFSVESADATKQYEFRNQMSLLELGKVVTIEKEEGVWYTPALLEMSLNLDTRDSFSLTFANALRLDDWGYAYADLISDAASTSRQISANWQNILKYSKEREGIASILQNPLDTTLRAASANMVNQEFTVDSNGILGRKKKSEASEDFELEQVRLVNNLLIFTDDGWKTAKTALGKIYYDNERGERVSSYGLVADTIIGSLIMGESLKIKNQSNLISLDQFGITIKHKDQATGNETTVLQAKSDGTLSLNTIGVDNFGLSLTNSSFIISTGSGDNRSNVLAVDKDGLVISGSGTFSGTLSGARGDFSGEITATKGYIGGWDIEPGRLYKKFEYEEDTLEVFISGELSDDPTVFRVDKNGTSTFYIRPNGQVYATDAEITGGSILLGEEGAEDRMKIDKTGLSAGHDTYGVRLGYSGIDLHWRNYALSNTNGINRTMFGGYPEGELTYGIHTYLDVIDCNEWLINVQTMPQHGSISIRFHVDSTQSECWGKLNGTWRGSVAETSDRNLKNSIESLSDKYDLFFDSILPVRFKFNDGTSNRYHTGFIAQDIEQSLLSAGLTTDEAALFVRFTDHKPNSAEEEITYALRYHEFISLNTWQIQKLKARIAELESSVTKLQGG